MVKTLLQSLFIFLILSTFSFAKDSDAKLKNEFGSDLTRAPFSVRYSFLRQYDKEWDESNYNERKTFLTNYKANSDAQQQKEKADAKALAQKDRDRQREKKLFKQKIAARLKADEAEKREYNNELKYRQKAFNRLVKDQKSELEKMVRDEENQRGQ